MDGGANPTRAIIKHGAVIFFLFAYRVKTAKKVLGSTQPPIPPKGVQKHMKTARTSPPPGDLVCSCGANSISIFFNSLKKSF